MLALIKSEFTHRFLGGFAIGAALLLALPVGHL